MRNKYAIKKEAANKNMACNFVLAAVRSKWCHTLACNKKATNWINANRTMDDGTEQQVGYCHGHYVRSLTNCR